MATDVASMPNGTYASHQAYPGIEQNSYAYSANANVSQPPVQQPPPASSTPSNAQTQSDVGKDEVGWYFVEQYYTTLSRSPEKLWLFYNKRSQFVSGQETDKVPVCIGQRAINDKIRDLDFQDCKVRVTNVDVQSSDSNIVIQVIGEISNKSQPHRKFTQTFVLATQTNGYFVLNDIFRYLVDEEDEPEAEAEAEAEAAPGTVQQVPGTESGPQEPLQTEAESKALTSSDDQAAIEHDANKVNEEIEEKLAPPPAAEEAPEPKTNGETVPEEVKAEEAPATPAQTETVPTTEVEQPAVAEPETEPEKPKDPEPTPVASPPTRVPVQAVPAPKPAAPPAPMTWAGRAAAANKVATPAAPLVATPAVKPTASTATAPKSNASTAAPVAAPAVAQPASVASGTPSDAAVQRQDTPESQDDWATVGHNRQQSRQTNTQQPEQPLFRGYIKNVMETVEQNDLRKVLEESFGELLYLDIARQKNCAFVDFKTAEGYNKATATPFKLGGTDYQVEERRFKPGSTPYIPRGNFQGGRGRGGAGGQGAPRGGGGFQNNRGNGAPRGGGRGGFAPRGRGVA